MENNAMSLTRVDELYWGSTLSNSSSSVSISSITADPRWTCFRGRCRVSSSCWFSTWAVQFCL